MAEKANNRFFLFGPQGIGKTRSAERIAAALGASHIMDDWHQEDGFPSDTLAISNYELPCIEGWEDVVVIQTASEKAIEALVIGLGG